MRYSSINFWGNTGGFFGAILGRTAEDTAEGMSYSISEEICSQKLLNSVVPEGIIQRTTENIEKLFF